MTYSPRTTERCVAAPLALEIVRTDAAITALHLSWAGKRPAELLTATGRAVQVALGRYVAGKAPDWPELPLDWGRLSPFARRVLAALAKVPYGQTLTYGQLAARAGSPKAARAVGRVMAANPFPLLYPCHRIIGAGGALTGFGPGLDMKRYLLELEHDEKR